MTVCKNLSSQQLKHITIGFIFLTLLFCVAKLPRLMQAGFSQQIDPGQLADAREGVSGTLNIDDMPRLLEFLTDNAGVVVYCLNFARHEQGWVSIDGEFSSCISMQCQRCMKPLSVELTQSVKVALVSSEPEARQIPAQFEPLIHADKTLSLKGFFEEEMILTLPLAPIHDTSACHRQESAEIKQASQSPSPFAALKDLKLKTSKD